MSARIKLRIRNSQGNREKVAFAMEPGERLPIHPDHEAFRAWSGEVQSPIGFLTYDRREGLLLEGTDTQPMLTLRGQIRPRFVLRNGDRWESPFGELEFLDVPLPVSDDEADSASATRLVGALPAETPHAADDVWPLEERSASREGILVALHFGFSALLLIFSAEIAQLVAMGFHYEISPLPTPFTALFANVLALGFAGILVSLRKRLEMSGGFLDYYRFLAWISAACVPWASSFAFPRGVTIATSLLLFATAACFFHIRFNTKTQLFVFTAAMGWAIAMGVGFFVLPRAMEKLPQVSLTERDLASAPEYSPGEALPDAQISGMPIVEDLHTQFFSAIRAGDLDTVRQLTERRLMDPEFTLEGGSTPLQIAVQAEKTAVVKYLLSRRANPNVQDLDGHSALAWAVVKENTEIAELLLKRRGDYRVRRKDGMSVLEIAQKLENPAMLDLLERYPPVDR